MIGYVYKFDKGIEQQGPLMSNIFLFGSIHALSVESILVHTCAPHTFSIPFLSLSSAETAQRMLSMAEHVVRAFAAASVQEGVPPAARLEIRHAMMVLHTQHTQQLQMLVSSLSEDQQQGLSRLMDSANKG